MIRDRKIWWVACVVDVVTMQVIREDIDATFARTVEAAHRDIANRNPLKPGEMFGFQDVSGPGAADLCYAIRERRTKIITCLKNLIENAC